MVKIMEQSCISKSNDESLNEDGLFTSEKYIAVIDGATSKDKCIYNNKTGGQIIRDIIIHSLSKLSGDESYEDAVYFIQQQIMETFPASKHFHASASAVIYSVNLRQVWFVGDCQALIGDILYDNKKEVDYILSKARSIVVSSLLATGKSINELRENDLSREAILPLLQYQLHLENSNNPHGFLVFNNKFMPKDVLREKCIVISVPLNSEIVLASDGYPVLCSSLEETERTLKMMLQEDPLCYKDLMGTKGVSKGNNTFDDRTYIRFKA